MLKKVIYKVKDIVGDYAVLVEENGTENTVAMFFLPSEIKIGSAIVYENLEYEML